MGSQESQSDDDNLLNILADAAHWTEEETVEKLQETLPIVIDFLQRNPPPEEGVQVARFVLGSFLPHLQVDKSFSLLDATLPALKSFFNEFVKECENEAKTNIDISSRLLQQCILITESCELMVQFLMQAENIDVNKVTNLPGVVLHVIVNSLNHCKGSESIYGSEKEKVSEPLNLLFRQTVELSGHFSGLLPKLIFDTYEDINVLIDVCEQLPITATCLSQLSEVRACVVVWRAYTSLIQHYHTHLITEMDVSIPLNALIKEISTSLLLMSTFSVQNKTLSDKDTKVAQRIIKMASFCLKIIIVLCEKFKGYLHSAHEGLRKLLIVLYRFFPENHMLQKFPDSVKTEVERQIAIGVEPLLAHLRDDEDFVKVVLKIDEDTEKEGMEDWGSYLLLLVALSSPPSFVTSLHIETILDKIFDTVQKSHASFSYPCKMPGVMCGGKPQTCVTIYEHVLTRICSLVAILEPENFQALEQLLIKWLLCGQTWPAIMASDVWCFVSRYGTSDLCKSHCETLSEILPHTPMYSHQQLVLTSLLTRLISKLSAVDKTEFLSHLRESGLQQIMNEVSLCCAVRENSKADQTKDIRKDLLNSLSQTIKSVVSKNASEEDVFNLLIKLEHTFPLLADFPLTDVEEAETFENCIQDLAQLWSRFPVGYIGCSVVDLLASGMMNSSSSTLNHYSNDQLNQMVSLCKSDGEVSPIIGVAICSLVAAAGKCSLLASSSPAVSQVLDCISDGLLGVLQSKNPFVYQSAIDAFVMFGQHTIHENVLPSCLQKCGEDLQGRVTNYLQQEIHTIPPGKTVCNLLQNQNVISCDDDIRLSQNSFVLIKESVKAEITTDLLQLELKSSKRKREEDLPNSYNVKSLIQSLEESRNIISRLKKRNEIEKSDRESLLILLREMVSEIS